MAIPEFVQHNADRMTQAFVEERMCLIEYADKTDGHPRYVLTEQVQDGDTVRLYPCAELFTRDPMEELEPPDMSQQSHDDPEGWDDHAETMADAVDQMDEWEPWGYDMACSSASCSQARQLYADDRISGQDFALGLCTHHRHLGQQTA